MLLSVPTIRPATPSDVMAVAAILKIFMAQQHKWHPEHYRPAVQAFTRENFERWLGRPNEFHAVAEVDAEVIGYVYGALLTSVATPFTFQRYGAQIAVLSVAKKGQRCGIGRKLCDRVEDWARSNKATYLILNVSPHNAAAQGFYASLGYQPFNEYRVKNF